jgi:nucleotide-binding universal stress UspA family protein
MTFDRILVPLDFGCPADRALPMAQAFARKLVARLDAVVVTSRGIDRAIEEIEARRHAQSLGCELDGVELRTEDDVVEGILAAAGSPRTLLCIATHARGAAADLAFRSVGEQVLRRTRQPVLAVGPRTVVDPPPRLDEIVSCVDVDPRQARRLLSVTADSAVGPKVPEAGGA